MGATNQNDIMIRIIQNFLEVEGKLSETDYNIQFFRIRSDQDSMRCMEGYGCKVGSDPKYYQKNRYRDIIPYDKNRVQLHPLNKAADDPLTDEEQEGYINASFIEFPPADAKYIAAQAPLGPTLSDWFAMIREHDVGVVVNLCKLIELGRIKCERYWPEVPDKEEKIGETILTLTKEEHFDEFCERHLKLRYADGFEKEIVQLHYSEWPDHGCPNCETHVLKMIETFDKLHYTAPEKPVLVHCSAGCGRTGTIIAANIVRELINSKNLKDELRLDDLVLELRKQRVSMVQTPDQYQFLHKLVVHFCREKLKSLGVEVPIPQKESRKVAPGGGDLPIPNNLKEIIDGSNGNHGTSVIPEYPIEPPLQPLGPEAPPVSWNEPSAITG